MGRDVIVACDFASAEATFAFLDKFAGCERKPIIANKTGGMSGPALLPLAVRMVYQVYDAVSIPIVGMGGVSKAEDVIELMLAGATAVQVGAANLVDPFACKRIIEDLPAVMKKYKIENLKDIIGGAH